MKPLAGKYGAVFRTQWKSLLEYKMNIWLKLVRPLVMVAAMGALWMVVFSVTGRERIGGLDRESFVLYLLVIRYVAVFSPGGASIAEMNEEIRTGNIMMRLVRPVHYLVWLFARNLPVPLFSGLVGLGALTGLAWLTGAHVPSGWQAGLFVLSVAGAVMVQYAIFQGIGVLSFWMYEVFPIERFYRTVGSLLSGEMVPLTVFGESARWVLQFLPFATVAFIPGGIYTGMFGAGEAAMLVGCQFAWGAVLWTVVVWLYNRGLQKFEAQGG